MFIAGVSVTEFGRLVIRYRFVLLARSMLLYMHKCVHAFAFVWCGSSHRHKCMLAFVYVVGVLIFLLALTSLG